MRFAETPVAGAFVIDVEPVPDERGLFARTFCQDEMRAAGLNPLIAQCNLSFNPRKGTLRGMHFQTAPHAETKLVRCTMGGIYDVIVDLRHDSPSAGRWYGLDLTAENRRMLYVPHGCAHGFISLTDDAEVFYQMGSPWVPGAGSGVRWNDPAFGITWPVEPALVSERDANWPLWRA